MWAMTRRTHEKADMTGCNRDEKKNQAENVCKNNHSLKMISETKNDALRWSKLGRNRFRGVTCCKPTKVQDPQPLQGHMIYDSKLRGPHTVNLSQGFVNQFQ